MFDGRPDLMGPHAEQSLPHQVIDFASAHASGEVRPEIGQALLAFEKCRSGIRSARCAASNPR